MAGGCDAIEIGVIVVGGGVGTAYAERQNLTGWTRVR
jgi:hypothetical protein